MPEPGVTPWETVGDILDIGGTQLTKLAEKFEQFENLEPPNTSSTKPN